MKYINDKILCDLIIRKDNRAINLLQALYEPWVNDFAFNYFNILKSNVATNVLSKVLAEIGLSVQVECQQNDILLDSLIKRKTKEYLIVYKRSGALTSS